MQQRTRGLLIAALFGLATLISACTQPPPQGPPRQTGEPAPAPAPAPPGAPSRVAAPALGVKVDNDLYVRDSLGQQCGDDCPEGQQYGYGMTSREGGAIELDGFVVTRSRLVGLQVGPGASLTGTRGEISASVIGINIQEPDYELADALPDVAFEGNDRNVDSELLPLPNTGLGEL